MFASFCRQTYEFAKLNKDFLDQFLPSPRGNKQHQNGIITESIGFYFIEIEFLIFTSKMDLTVVSATETTIAADASAVTGTETVASSTVTTDASTITAVGIAETSAVTSAVATNSAKTGTIAAIASVQAITAIELGSGHSDEGEESDSDEGFHF